MTPGPAPAKPNDALLTLTTLGGADVRAGTGIVLNPGKPFALVVYLALTPGHTATREFLLDLLWADLDRDRARHALRQTLWQLRQTLGDTIVTGREELTLGVRLDSDRDGFLAAVESGDPEAAITIYRGGFLTDFALPGCVEFEHWADIERSRLRSTFLRAAEMVARRRLAVGKFREAQEVARRMRDADGLHETGCRLLIEALLANRDLIHAAVEAESLRAVLAKEGREPEPATASVLESLRRAQGQVVDEEERNERSLVAELVGREREFAAILEAWAQARQRPGRHVQVTAAAGLGKTRLLSDVANRLRAIGARVVQLRASPGDRSVGFAFAGDLAEALADLPGLPGVAPASADVLVGLHPALSSRFPDANPVRDRSELLRLRTMALSEAISAIADERPVALLVDDVHWVDADSEQVLEGIVNRLDKAPVLVLTAGRPAIGRSLVGTGSIELELPPLSAGGVRDLLTSIGRLADDTLLDAVAEQLHRSSGGSPLLVLESLQLALDRATLRLDGPAWVVPDAAGLLADLETQNAVRSRLQALDPETAWVLALLATAGTPLTANELMSTMRGPGQVDERLWLLERKGFIRRTGSSWEAAHDEIASAALERESVERLRASHQAIGSLLLENPAAQLDGAMQAARHFAAAYDDHGLRLAYRKTVALARQAGDRRSNLELARLVSGGPDGSPGRLVRSLPLRNRLGLHSNARLTAAAVLALGVMVLGAWGAGVFESGPSPLQAELLVLTPSPNRKNVVEISSVGVDRRNWRRGTPLRMSRPFTEIRDSMFALSTQSPDLSPDGKRWVVEAPVDNERTDDIFLFERGDRRVLAPAFRDDGAPQWSPDGSSILFTTARWSRIGADDYDLAVLQLDRSDEPIRLTATSDFDRTPSWAPHGALIAFARLPRDLEPSSMCWITANGDAEHCMPTTLGLVSEIIGWIDGGRVLARVVADDRSLLVRWDLLRDQVEVVETFGYSMGRLSGDGRWLACWCARDLNEQPTWLVVPVDDPGAGRPLPLGSVPQRLAWRKPGAPDRGLTIRTAAKTVRVVLRGSQAPSVTLVDADSQRILLPTTVLRWRSADTSIATVDAVTGQISGKRVGTVRVTASLAGRFSETITAEVTADSAQALLADDWSWIDPAVWQQFGVPAPRIVRDSATVTALNNNGDGSYASGVFSTKAYDPSFGLAFEAKVAWLMSRSQWQQQSIELRTAASTATAAWDRRTRSPVQASDQAHHSCAVVYPAGEGVAALSRVQLSAGGEFRRSVVDSTWPNGGWHAALIQLFPDGSCGFALDGKAVWRSAARVPVDRPYRVWLSGNSAGTDRILVGPVKLWEGVRQEVDWAALDPTP